MIRTIVKEAQSYLFNSSSEFWRPLLLPALLFCLIDFVPNGLLLNSALVYHLLSIALCAILMSTTHRLVLLGPSSVSTGLLPSPKDRVIHYFLYSLVLEVIMIITAFISASPAIFAEVEIIPKLFWFFLGYLVGAIIGSRFCLILPASSINETQLFSDSWTNTSETPFTAFAVFILIPAALMLPGFLLDYLDGWFFKALWSLISTAMIVVGVIYLSVYYQHVGRLKGEKGDRKIADKAV